MIWDQLLEDLNKALKEKDEITVSTLRMAIANLKNAKITKGGDLTDDEVLSELLKDAKRHKESISAFEKASRQDLVQKEKAELAVLSKYLPQELGQDEIKKIVDEAIAQVNPSGIGDMGKVMSAAMGNVAGRADGAIVSSIVREKLSNL